MQKNFKVFTDAHEILTLKGAHSKKGMRATESDLTSISDGVMVCVNERIAWLGPRQEFNSEILRAWGGEKAAEFVSLKGQTLLPGFVEPHTHLIFAGNRAHEFEWRIKGQSYQEIAAKGGGIRHTVEQTRQASRAQLLALAERRAAEFVRQGVTTLEVKSGYGLDLETEKRSLEVARALQAPRVVTTYLGAHSRSPELPEFDAYIEDMCTRILPEIARLKLADRVDIYVEKGFFTPAHAKRYLSRARELGLGLTAHVEQLSDSGGAMAALALAPQSLDHLVFASDEVIAEMARTETVGVLLPTSDLYLKMAYPRARDMIDRGVCVALSTDFNPGTSPTQDLSLVGVLARLEMKMSLAEVLVAYTVGAARALGLTDRGALTVGNLCDFACVNTDWRELFYAVGSHPVIASYRGGETLRGALKVQN